MKKIVITGIILLLFLGYAPYQELNDLAVVDFMALDFKDSKYKLYLNIINMDNTVYELVGDSLGEVFFKAKNVNNKKTYYNHLNVALFSTNILKEKELLTFLKDEFTNIDYVTLGTKDNIEDILDKFHQSSEYESFITKEKEDLGSIINVTFKDLLSNSMDDIKTPLIPLITIQDNVLHSNGGYLFSKDTYLDNNISKASYLISNKISSYSQKVEIDDNYYEVFLSNLKTNINYKDNTLKITIKGDINSPDTDNLEKIKKIVINDLKNDVNSFILVELDNKKSFSNIINYIYLKEKDKPFDKYKDAKKEIVIDLKEKEKSNYD